jgi:drug/metabolite transporter (DMT)-like permease
LADEMPSETSRGYLYAFLAAVCSGAIPTLSKVLLPQTGPVALSGLAFFISAAFLIPIPPSALPGRKSLPYVVLFGMLGALIAPVIYQMGLEQTTVVNASLLANGEILFTSLLAFTFFGERLTTSQLGRGLLIVAGIVIVSTNLELASVQFLSGLEGNLLILASTLGWSVENNLLVSATRRFGTPFITKYRNLIGGGILMVVVLAAGIRVSLTSWEWLLLVVLAALMGGASFLIIAAFREIGAIRTILVYSSSTIFGAVFALVFLREQITVVQVVGGILILVGVYAFQRTKRMTPNAPV